MRILRNIKQGIKNVWKWLPIVWDDKQWDHVYLYIILRHKLSIMERYFRENGHLVRSEEDAKKMKLCILLLDRLIKDDYSFNAFKKHDKKWGEIDLKRVRLPNGSTGCCISRPNAITRKEKEKERKETIRCAKHEDYLRKQDIVYLFDTIKKHIRSWWD